MKVESMEDIIDLGEHFTVVQAGNIDADSLSSALALEDILHSALKKVELHCSIDVPNHLKYIQGWDRVSSDFSNNSDVMIVVDAASVVVLDKTYELPQANNKTMKTVVIDHHVSSKQDLPGDVTYVIDDKAVSTSEVIFNLCKESNTDLSLEAMEFIAISIMADSLGLVSPGTTHKSIRAIADLVKSGVRLDELEKRRRELTKRSIDITRFKARLMREVEFIEDDAVAVSHVSWEDIQKYSHEYNPSVLILDELRFVKDLKLAVAFKTYPDGKVLAKIRSLHEDVDATVLAKHFGGGGHSYVAGFKLTLDDNSTFHSTLRDAIKELYKGKL